MLTRRAFLQGLSTTAAASLLAGNTRAAETPDRPNIIFILSDDVGYGDLGCYGAQHVKTPNLDRIAREGVRCTDAHSTSSVCTPSRYSLLTGQYAWRNPLGNHILSGVEPLSIDPASVTAPSLLRQAGYATGLVGKWHLGLGTREKPVDYNADIAPGPLEVGFDYAYFYAATNDRVPCVYIENRRVVGLDPADPIQVSYGVPVGDDPTGKDHPELLKIKSDESHSKTIVNGVSRIGYMAGGHAARWVDEDMADTFTGKAVSFIEQHRAAPFFLYFTPHDIHEPMVPHPRFRGTSTCGTRGDAIHELDWSVGQILDTLDRLGLAQNTLILYSSDNGGAIKDTYDDGTNAEHGKQPPNGVLRGSKGQLYEGGHRVPLLARWPGHIPAGGTSDALVGLVDMLPTFAAAAGASTPAGAGPDAVNVLPAMLGGTAAPPRDMLVLHTNAGGPLGLRKGDWMLVTHSRDNFKNAELYNLKDDLPEKNNVAKEHPETVQELVQLLQAQMKA